MPQTNANEIIERINVLGRAVSEQDELNIFSWNGLLKDIQKLESLPGLGETSLLHQAVMWGMRPNRDKIRSLFNHCAVKYGKTPSWHLIRSNYATLFGDVSMVTDLLTSGFGRGGPSHLAKVVDILVASGFYITAWSFLNEISKQDIKTAELLENRYPFLGFTAEYLTKHDLDEVDVARRVTLSSKLVADAGFRLRKFAVSAGNYGVSVELIVNAEIDRLVDLNLTISDAIAETFEELISEHVTTGVVPWEANT